MKSQFFFASALIIFLLFARGCGNKNGDIIELLNVSYDPTRELYKDYNQYFESAFKEKHGKTIKIKQSHGGSGKQARAVMDGLNADIVTLALAYDIDIIAEKTDLLPQNWQENLPERSCPYHSVIVFLIRKGNPKNIQDWDDLIRDDIEIITPNPKTSGGARWNYLAAWGFALKEELGEEKFKNLGIYSDSHNKAHINDHNSTSINDHNGTDTSDENMAYSSDFVKANSKAQEFVRKIFGNVPVLDTGARGATNTFVQRGIGDVLLAWENEALLAMNEIGDGNFQIVYPSITILAEPPIAIVGENARRNGNFDYAQEYLSGLYSQEGQKIVAQHYYRPAYPEMVENDKLEIFRPIRLFTIDDLFGGWAKAQATHFDEGGIFDIFFQ